MKKIILSVLLAGFAMTVSAESQLSMDNRAILRRHKVMNAMEMPGSKLQMKAMKQYGIPTNHITGLIKLDNAASVEQLEAEGVNVVRVRGDIALVSMPVNDVERISALRSVKKLQLSRPLTAKMDSARRVTGIDKIHAGEGLPQAYTGKGVIAGIVDGGVEPNHINFKKEDGSTRFTSLTHIFIDNTAEDGYSVVNYSGKVNEFTIDDPNEFHGTHTTGIMAGSYKGNVSAATLQGAAGVVKDMANPYYGVAYDADIAASCGDLNEMFIALGMEGILDHAYNTGKPAVINLSVGTNVGPHDGTGVMNQYLELAGKEAIICMAAGNEGALPIALTKNFTATDNTVKTFIHPMYPDYFANYPNLRWGQIYIYSKDSTEFKANVKVINKSRNTQVLSFGIEGNTNGAPTYMSAGDGWTSDGDISHLSFTRYFNGYIGIGSWIDEDSGRYVTLLDYLVFDTSNNATGNYIIGFEAIGSEGQRIDAFCDGQYTAMSGYGLSGWTDGSTNGTINDLATGENVIVVGAYNTREHWCSLDRYSYTYGQGKYPEGQVASYSSFGTLVNGKNLPHVCAPGSTIISSSSTAYVENNSLTNDALQAKVTEGETTYYWHQQLGTSMATPVVTGSMALWLEANPKLTVNEAIDIINTTALKDDYVTTFSGDPVQWGAGKFDAYAGLKEVIRRAGNSGIKDITAKTDRLMVTSAGKNVYNVFLGDAEEINVTIFNMQGQAVKAVAAAGDEVNVDASTLAAGVYVLNVNGAYSQKIIVK